MAERPVDRRAYRYRKVPSHFYNLIQHADVRVAAVRNDARMTDAESWRFFCRGSAYHMHVIYRKSALRFCDICAIERGESLEKRREAFRDSVLRHVRALEWLRTAAQRKRLLSMTLVREVLRVLAPDRCVRARTARKACELAAWLGRIRQAKDHPVIKAGDVLERMYWLDPYPGYAEQLGYLLANFILMRAGYPPAILYRIVFTTMRKYHETYRQKASRASDARFWVPPEKYRAFLCACVIRAVVRSCRLGLHPVCPR